MSDEEQEIIEDLRNPDVVTKYRKAGDIANDALKHVLSLCKPGAKIADLTAAGDEFIDNATSGIYNAKKGKNKVEKGIGFPTCLSVGHVVGHFSPLANDETTLSEGDIVKL